MDRDDNDLNRSKLWWQNQTVVIRMGHYQRAHHTCGKAPTGRPWKFLLIFLVNEFNVERSRKILAEKVGRAGLQSLAVLHQCFDTICFYGSRKTFARLFQA